MEGNQDEEEAELWSAAGLEEPLENQEVGFVRTPGKLGISIFRDDDEESLDRRYSCKSCLRSAILTSARARAGLRCLGCQFVSQGVCTRQISAANNRSS
jgi:hypothetical protein